MFVWTQTGAGYSATRRYDGPSQRDTAVGGSVAVSDDGIIWVTGAQWLPAELEGFRIREMRDVGTGALFRIDDSETGGPTIRSLSTPDYEAQYDQESRDGTVGLGTSMKLSGDGRFLIVGAESSDLDGNRDTGGAFVFNTSR